MFKYGGRRKSIVEADRLSKVVLNLFCIQLFLTFHRKLFLSIGSEQRLDMHIKANVKVLLFFRTSHFSSFAEESLMARLGTARRAAAAAAPYRRNACRSLRRLRSSMLRPEAP